MTPVTCRAARALLNWTLKELAAAAGVSHWTVMEFELRQTQALASTVEALRGALTKGGVIFLKPVRDGGSGARLSRSVESVLERRVIGSSRKSPETLTPANCRAARALLGWSVEELAGASGVNSSTIKSVETGRHTPIAATAGALRRCLTEHGVILVEAVAKDGSGARLSRSAEALRDRAKGKRRIDREDCGTLPDRVDVTPVTCRAARALLGWRLDDLVAAADVSKSTVRLFETGEQRFHRSTADAIRGCLAGRGVIFVEAVGEGGSGVRLSRSVEGLREVGGIWRAARALLGWSFDELAVEAGVKGRTLLAIESGQESALSTPTQTVRRALTSAGVIFLKPDHERGRGVKLLRSAETLRDLLVIGTSKKPAGILLTKAKERIERYREESVECGALRDLVSAEIERREGLGRADGASRRRRQQLSRKFEATGELLERVSGYLEEWVAGRRRSIE